MYFDLNTVEGSPINIPTNTEHDDDDHQTQVYENTNTAINDQISDSQDNTYQNGTGVVHGATSQQNYPVPLVKNELYDSELQNGDHTANQSQQVSLVKNELYNSESQADCDMTDENEIYHEARQVR